MPVQLAVLGCSGRGKTAAANRYKRDAGDLPTILGFSFRVREGLPLAFQGLVLILKYIYKAPVTALVTMYLHVP